MSKSIPTISYDRYYNRDFTSLDQIQKEYERMNNMRLQKINADNYVPGVEEYFGNAASFASASASIGGMIDPLWGTIAGGVIGAGAGLVKTGIDESNIRNAVDARNIRNAQLANDANRRLGYSADILQDDLFRKSEAHAVANGGNIERKQMSLKEFADYANKKKIPNDYAEGSRIERIYCKGGVKISFK